MKIGIDCFDFFSYFSLREAFVIFSFFAENQKYKAFLFFSSPFLPSPFYFSKISKNLKNLLLKKTARKKAKKQAATPGVDRRKSTLVSIAIVSI